MSDGFDLVIIREDSDTDLSIVVDADTEELVVVNDNDDFELEVAEVSDNEFELVITLENVVINQGTPIVVSATEPENPTEGMIWLQI